MIQIENINKYYKLGKGRFHALKNVSLEIGDGELVSVEGRSGAGKPRCCTFSVVWTALIREPTCSSAVRSGKWATACWPGYGTAKSGS